MHSIECPASGLILRCGKSSLQLNLTDHIVMFFLSAFVLIFQLLPSLIQRRINVKVQLMTVLREQRRKRLTSASAAQQATNGKSDEH